MRGRRVAVLLLATCAWAGLWLCWSHSVGFAATCTTDSCPQCNWEWGGLTEPTALPCDYTPYTGLGATTTEAPTTSTVGGAADVNVVNTPSVESGPGQKAVLLDMSVGIGLLVFAAFVGLVRHMSNRRAT